MSEVTQWQYVCILVHFITKMSLPAARSNWSVCAGSNDTLSSASELRPTARLIISIDEWHVGHCRIHTKVQKWQSYAFLQISSEYLQPSVSSWSGWGSCWPSLVRKSPGGTVFFATELLDEIKWKGNASKVKAIWRAHHKGSTSCPAQIEKDPSLYSGWRARNISRL